MTFNKIESNNESIWNAQKLCRVQFKDSLEAKSHTPLACCHPEVAR